SYLDSFAATNEGKELNALLDPLKDWPVELKNLRATGSSKEGYGKFTKPRTSSADSDSSIRWTYSDSKTATYIISKSFLEGGWVQTFTAAKGHPPVVTVGPIRDKTDEQIDMNTLIFDLTVELSFRSNVEFKHSWNWGLMPRNARWDQVEMISAESATRLRDSLGIDVFLQGSITRAGKTFGSYQHTEYVLELEAIETETMMRLWSDFHLTDKPNITPNSP
ncbi:MAG: penicillin-binding protein activator LpoB, partial [candidate division Zixibacteria bacterium]|nr:penicillin-binding protein activator LpoB [candidate division Zixibacteria bacterium]